VTLINMTTSTGEGRVDSGATEQRAIPQDTFAGRLMLVRLHAGGLTIQEAAERCGLTNQSWSNWEKGMKPRDLLDVVNAISDGLEIDRDWLLFGGPLAPPEAAGRRQLKRRAKRDTAQYGPGVIRASANRSTVAQPGPFAHVPDRPTAGTHRPTHRRERATTGPNIVRPAVLPRRTSV